MTSRLKNPFRVILIFIYLDVDAMKLFYFTESSSGGLKLADGFPTDTLVVLLDTLTWILTELPIENATYILHLEAVNTIIVALSQQMFASTKPAFKLSQYR